MSDKTFRPITDVEIVEQMTANDTVLIERNGMIKRTKGVVGGGGEKYIIDVYPGTEDIAVSWATPVVYDDFLSKFTAGENVRVIQHLCFEGIGVVAIAEAIIEAVPSESLDAVVGINFLFAHDDFVPITFNSDGTLQIMEG